MSLPLLQLHKRYQQQAGWTTNLRNYIYDRIGIGSAKRVLEVGCGTGVIVNELANTITTSIFGLDINPESALMAKNLSPNVTITIGDGINLPFQANTFDVSFCHFVLLWLRKPSEVMHEMYRVTKSEGFVLALAEPDYGGRIDFPNSLYQIGAWQSEALSMQGANPNIGRELRAIFSATGLKNVEVGVIGGQWGEDDKENYDFEWEVLESDLKDNKIFQDNSKALRNLDRESRLTHQRILYVPTFYAIGRARK